MIEDWSGVAAEVADALKDVSSDGDGYPVLLQRPGQFSGGIDAQRAEPSYHDLIGMMRRTDVRDGTAGAVTATQRRIMVNASGVTPQKSDRIALGLRAGQQTDSTQWDTILAVKTVSPAGVPVYHILTLEN